MSTVLPSIRERESSLGPAGGIQKLSHDAGALTHNTADDSGSADSPFRVPSDAAIFQVCAAEKEARRLAALEMAAKPVHAKTTFASRMAETLSEESKAQLPPRARPPARQPAADTLAEAAMPAGRPRRDRERIADFIAKKREIFLVQMSLDTKRAEIRKLEERAIQREEALKRSEQMLEDDAVQFDRFLRENENKVNEAIKRSDAEAKKRAEKQMEHKRLHSAIAALRSELNKHEEQLQDCRTYRDFLDGITPPAWFEARAAERRARRDAVDAAWHAECRAVEDAKAAARAAKDAAEHDYANAQTQQAADRAQVAIKETTAALAEALAVQPPAPPAPVEEADDDGGAYFREPQQLLDILSDLEEQNLFLIQNGQEVEEGLDAITHRFKSTQATMNAELASLQSQRDGLEAAIAAERLRLQLLQSKTSTKGDASSLLTHDVSLDDLASKVEEVYRRCGFDYDPSATPLQMLKNIEMRLEEHLAGVKRLPAETWSALEKEREKGRRVAMRECKQQQQKEEHDRRVKKALERAAAPVFKKTGKPVMFRSHLVRKKREVVVDDRDEDEIDLEMFLARDMI